MAAATVELTDLPALCLATIAEFLGSLCHADNDRLLMRTEIDLARDALALWVTSRAVRVALAVPLAADIVPFVHVGFGIPWVLEDPNGRSVIGLMSHMRVPLLSEGRDASGGPMLSRQALAHMDISDARHSFRRDILFDLGPEVLARLTTTTTTPGGRRYLPMRRRLLELLGPDSATHAKHAKRLREEHRARCELRREALDCALRLRGFTRRHNSQAAMTFACGHDADRDVPSSSSTLAEAVRLTEFAWSHRGATTLGAVGTSTRAAVRFYMDYLCVFCGCGESPPAVRCSNLLRCETCIAAGCFDAWRHRRDVMCVCDACRRKTRVGRCITLECGCVVVVVEDLLTPPSEY